MPKRYVGDATVSIRYVGQDSEDRPQYAGRITLPNKKGWSFKDLGGPRFGGGSVDSPSTLSKMASSAVSFASYYTTHNRGDDVPSWAPSASLADAIEEAVGYAQRDDGEYEVRSSKSGKVASTSSVSLPPGTRSA